MQYGKYAMALKEMISREALCSGMEMEAKQNAEEAKALFLQAWYEATNDIEKFTTTRAKQRTNSCSE